MTFNGAVQVVVFLSILILLAKPLGIYIARIFEGKPVILNKWFLPVERLIYRLCGINPEEEMTWKTYAFAMMAFNIIGLLTVYFLQRCQQFLPLNPMNMPAVSPDSAFNTAVSFATNTNWQGYAGETTMSYLTQMLGLTVQNFVSAATGIAILIALVRGFIRREANNIGNFWTDLVRTTLYILLPLSILLSVALVSQGVVQTFKHAQVIEFVQPLIGSDGKPVTT